MNWRNLRHEIDWALQNHLTASAPVIKRRLRDTHRLTSGLTPLQQQRHHELLRRTANSTHRDID